MNPQQEITISRVGNRDKVYLRTDFGLPINRVIARVVSSLLASELDEPIPYSMDAGRIIIEADVEPKEIEAKLSLLEEDDVERLLRGSFADTKDAEGELRGKYDVMGARKVIGMVRSGRLVLTALELKEPLGMMAQGYEYGSPRTFARGLRTWTESLILTVPAGTAAGHEVYTERVVRAGGRIMQLILFFPAGTQGTTGIFVTIEGQQVFPATDGDSIALDATSQPYSTDLEVRRGDRLRFNGNNSDSVPHTVRLQYTVKVSAVNE